MCFPQVRHQQINEGRGEAADGHLQELWIQLQTPPKHPHLIWNELCETGFLNHKSQRQSFPKTGLEDDLHLDLKSFSSHWTYPLWFACVTEKSQNFLAERGWNPHFLLSSSQERNWNEVTAIYFLYEYFFTPRLNINIYSVTLQRFPLPQIIHCRGIYFLKNDVLGDWREQCPVAGF